MAEHGADFSNRDVPGEHETRSGVSESMKIELFDARPLQQGIVVLRGETRSPDWRTIFPTKYQVEIVIIRITKSQPFLGLPCSVRSKFCHCSGRKGDCADRVRRLRRLQHEPLLTSL